MVKIFGTIVECLYWRVGGNKMAETTKLRAKITFEWDYDADPNNYRSTPDEDITVEDMIELDKASADDDTYLFLEGNTGDVKIEIKEVK